MLTSSAQSDLSRVEAQGSDPLGFRASGRREQGRCGFYMGESPVVSINLTDIDGGTGLSQPIGDVPR